MEPAIAEASHPERRALVRRATLEDSRHAASISEAIRAEVEAGSIGMALRSAKLIVERMRAGDAIIAVAGAEWAGFCYLSPWEGGAFVSTSALIVPPRFRGLGLARRLKEEALRLGSEQYPQARPFGLSTSPAVIGINRSLGLREVSYRELPRDPAFWKGCETCPLHATLVVRRGDSCHCTAMVR